MVPKFSEGVKEKGLGRIKEKDHIGGVKAKYFCRLRKERRLVDKK